MRSSTVAGHGRPHAIREDYHDCYAGDRSVESMGYVRRYPDELALAQRLGEIEKPVMVVVGLRDRVARWPTPSFWLSVCPNVGWPCSAPAISFVRNCRTRSRNWSASGSMYTTNPIEVRDVQVRQHDRFTKERA